MPVNSGVYEIILTNGCIIKAYSNDFRGVLRSYLRAKENYFWIIQENSFADKITCIRNDLVLYIRFPQEIGMDAI